MSTISHPNIVPFIGFYVDRTDLRTAYVVAPYMSNGNVGEYLEDNDVDIQKRLELVIGRIIVSDTSYILGMCEQSFFFPLTQ